MPEEQLNDFVDTLKSRSYPELRLEFAPLAGQKHFADRGEGLPED